MSDFPTPWQKKTIWAALSALAVVTIGAIAVGLVWTTSHVLRVLQPILIPFAVAGVMAYLLDPVVTRLVAWGHSRHRAVLCVFAIVVIGLAGILLWVLPAVSRETSQLVRKLPKLTTDARDLVTRFAKDVKQKYNIQLLPDFQNPEPAMIEGVPPEPPLPSKTIPSKTIPLDSEGRYKPGADPSTDIVGDTIIKSLGVAEPGDQGADLQAFFSGDWLRNALPTVIRNIWKFISASVGGFLGVFGFLLSMVIVPIYLYYFLIESRNISMSWGDYLPLRTSSFKDEVVSTLEEINGYLIAFFRGQLLVSMINGTATGLGLLFIGLDFGLLIGLLLCFLGLIPYLGIVMCWIPAVIIAAVQGGSWLLPASPWWVLPLAVTAIFFVVQQIDGLFITPKIVGESVGLHPMTVIVSVFVWTLLMGGLLGAILAVPMTATIKVLLKRFVWQRRFMSGNSAIFPTEESFAVDQAQGSGDRPPQA